MHGATRVAARMISQNVRFTGTPALVVEVPSTNRGDEGVYDLRTVVGEHEPPQGQLRPRPAPPCVAPIHSGE